MSEPAEERGPPPEPPPEPPSSAPPRRPGAWVSIAAAAAVIIVAIAATPFWAPAVTQLLPWGIPQEKPQIVEVAPAPDPALAAVKAEASQNAVLLQQLSQRMTALEARPTPDLSSIQHELSALEAKPPPDLSSIQQQLGALSKTTADLTTSVAALDKAAQAQPATDPKNTAMALLLLQIRDAVDTGRPFNAEYHALAALARDNPDIAAAATPLAGPAESGVASRAALTERLRQLAPEIATAKPPPKASWKSQIVARLRSLVTIRRIDGAEQTPAEAAVSTAERDVASGDLVGAIDALSGLTGPSQTAAEPWLRMAKARLAVEEALRQVEAALTAAVGGAAPALSGKG
jgi:hypothetical protein